MNLFKQSSVYKDIKIRYIELCNMFSRISNSFPRVINSFPRISHLSDCNSFPRNWQSVLLSSSREHILQSEGTSCVNRANELPIRGNELLFRENGLHNSI